MRNIKRVLSLALASVMLLGMMVVGSSAAFSDADSIVNKEAVEITAGLGLFAGSDGKFNPTGTVTRAQMAAVIAKMFYGSDLNADTYKGSGKFSDTASFEGGWAEGYINLGVEKGWFAGYGDGTFKPGNAVTTAEAVTMLINLLDVDAGEGTWPMTVMAAAEEIDLFDLDIELKPAPATNVALTRDQLAVVVWNGLNYSAEGKNVYMVGDKKFETAADAHYYAQSLTPAGTIEVLPAEDALVTATFGLKSLTGYVTANQATGADCTTVEKVDGTTVSVDLQTGLDMIGHFVTVYYAEEYESEKEPGTAYCVYDEAEYVVVEKAIEAGDRKAFNAAFGSKRLTASAEAATTSNTYVVTTTDSAVIGDYGYDYDNKEVDTLGTYIVFEGKIIGFITPAAKTVVEVQKIVTKAGNESIRVGGNTYSNTEDNDLIVEYEGIAVEDTAIMVDAQGVKYLTKAEQITGEVAKQGTDEDGNPTITVDGKVYGFADYAVAGTSTVNFTTTYVFFLDGDKIIAKDVLQGSVDLSKIVYVVGAYETDTTDAYGNDIKSAYAQVVDMEGKESSLLIGINYDQAKVDLKDLGVYVDTNGNDDVDDDTNDKAFVAANYAKGFAVYETSKYTADAKKAGIMVISATDTIETTPVENEETLFKDALTNKGFDSKTVNVNTDGGELAFLGENTKFILINGAASKALEVSVKTGLVNLPNTADTAILAVADANGNVTLEVVVYVEDNMQLPSDEVIYVSEAQIAAQETVADGTEVEVYFLNTKKFDTILVETAFTSGNAGFYTYTYDATEDIYSDMLSYSAGIEDDQVLKGLYGGDKLITVSGDFAGNDASEAVVIDTRAAKDIEKSDFAKVEDLKDLADLIDSDIHVIMDVVVDTDDINEPVTFIFVLDVAEHTYSAGTCTGCGATEPTP